MESQLNQDGLLHAIGADRHVVRDKSLHDIEMDGTWIDGFSHDVKMDGHMASRCLVTRYQDGSLNDMCHMTCTWTAAWHGDGSTLHHTEMDPR